ncbi:MAG: hypothetical protein GWP14_01665 [Actinobacteria bacterium]|nr:hypothetical protein [Actinomycetota bacterium]
MRRYMVKRVSTEVSLSHKVLGAAWSDADELSIDSYPWFKSGRKECTTARLLYDQKAVYVQFLCKDKHIYADHTEINSSVCEDSCVEFFAQPIPQVDQRYFNLEINCCGTFLLGWGRSIQEIAGSYVDPALSTAHLKIAASVAGPPKQESPDDNGWSVAVQMSFELISRLSGRQIRPTSGSVWRANFYRCGGRTNRQYACWNRVGTPSPDYHRPEFFGELLFE